MLLSPAPDRKQLHRGIPAGQIFIFSRGKYSDYEITGVYRTLKAIDNPDEWVRQFIEEKSESWYSRDGGGLCSSTWAEFDREGMIAQLEQEGFIEAVDDYSEWFLP